MGKFKITWEIDSDLDTPLEAAREAFDAMQRPGTEATVFEVLNEVTGERHRVDLLGEEPEVTRIT